MVTNSKQRSAIAKWLMDSGDATSSSFVSNNLDRALNSPKLGSIEAFASATFTQAEVSQIGIPEDILGRAQARAQEFIGNKTAAINTINARMDFLTSEQFNSAMSAVDRAMNFDKKLDAAGWASSILDRSSNIDVVTGERVSPTGTHNLTFGRPSEARVTTSIGNNVQVRSAEEIFRGAAGRGGYQYENETVDQFGIPVNRFSRGEGDNKTFFDLSYEQSTGALLWGESNSTKRAVMGRTIQAGVEGEFNKQIGALQMLEPGDVMQRIISGAGKPSRISSGTGFSSGGLETIDIQTSTHHSLMDASRKVNVPTSIDMDKGYTYNVTPGDLATMSGWASARVSGLRGRETIYAPIDYSTGSLRESTQTVRQSLGYYIDPSGEEQMRTVKTAKDSKREYMRGASGGFGVATGLVNSLPRESMIRQAGFPGDTQQVSNVVFTDDRAAFGEGEAKVLAGRYMINSPNVNVMYGYNMENLPFKEGDVFTRSGNAPARMAEGSRFAGSMRDLDVNNFQFGNEAERLINKISWDEKVGAPVVHSVAGSYADIGEFKVSSGIKGQMTPVGPSDPHYTAIQQQLGFTPDIIAPQASKDERMRNIALRMFQAEEDPMEMRRFLRAASVGQMNDEQFGAAFGTSGPVNVTGAHGNIIADAASMYTLARKGFEYNVSGVRINAADWESFVEKRKHVYGEDSGILNSQAVRNPAGDVMYYTADYKARGISSQIMGDLLPKNVTGKSEISPDLFSAMAINQPEAYDIMMNKFNMKRSSVANLVRGVAANTMSAGRLTQTASDIRSTMEYVDIKDMGIDDVVSMVNATYKDMTDQEKERMVLSELGKRHRGKHIMSNGMVMLPADVMAKNYAFEGRDSMMSIGPQAYKTLMGHHQGLSQDELSGLNQDYFDTINAKIENSSMKELGRMTIAGFGGPAKALEIPGDMHVVREEDAARILRSNVGADAAKDAMRQMRTGGMYGIANIPHGQRNMTWSGARIVTQEWLRGDELGQAGFWDEYDKIDETDPAKRAAMAQQILQGKIKEVQSKMSRVGATEGLYNESAMKILGRRSSILQSYQGAFNEFGADFFKGFSNLSLSENTTASSIDFIRASNKDFDGDNAPNIIPIPGLRKDQLRAGFEGDWRSRSFLSTGLEALGSIGKFGRDMFGVLRRKESEMGALTPQKIRGSVDDMSGDIGGAFATQGMGMSYQPYHRNLYAAAIMHGGMDDAALKNAAGMAGDVVYQPFMDKHVIKSLSSQAIMFGRSRMRMAANQDPSKFGLNLVGSVSGNKTGNRVDFEELMFDMMATSGMQIGTGDDEIIYDQEGGVADAMARMLSAGGDLKNIRQQLVNMRKAGMDAEYQWTENDNFVKTNSTVSRQARMSLLGAAIGTDVTNKNYRQALRQYVLGVGQNDEFDMSNMSAMSSWLMSEVARNTLDINEMKPYQVKAKSALMSQMSPGQRKAFESLAGQGRALDAQRMLNEGGGDVGQIMSSARSIMNHPVMRGGAQLMRRVLGTGGYDDGVLSTMGMRGVGKNRFALVGEVGPEILDRATGDVIPNEVVDMMTGGLPHEALNIKKMAKGSDDWESSYADFLQSQDASYFEGLSAGVGRSDVPPVSGMAPGKRKPVPGADFTPDFDMDAYKADKALAADYARSNMMVGNVNIANIESLNQGDIQTLRSAQRRFKDVREILKQDPHALTRSKTFARSVADLYSGVDDVLSRRDMLKAAGMSTAVAGDSEDVFGTLAGNMEHNYMYTGEGAGARMGAYKQLGRAARLEMMNSGLGTKAGEIAGAMANVDDLRVNYRNILQGVAGAQAGQQSNELWQANRLLKDYNFVTGEGRETSMSPTAAARLSQAVRQAEGRGVKASAPTMDEQGVYAPNAGVENIPKLMEDFSDQIKTLQGALPDTNKEMANFVGTFGKVSQMYKSWNEEFQSMAGLAAAGNQDAQARLAQMKPDQARMQRIGSVLEGAQANAFEAQMRVGMSRYGAMGLDERESLLAQYSQQGGFTGRRRRAGQDYADLRESVLDEKYGESGIVRSIAGATFEPAAAATRMMNRATGTMFATMMARNQIMVPMGQLADTYQSQEIARQQNLMMSGTGGSYSDFMSGEYGQIRRRSARNELGMGAIGKEIYNTWGGVMNAGLGETFTPLLGNAASLAGPAIGAGMIAKQAFGSGTAGLVAGTAMYLAGSGISAINNMQNPEATTDTLYNLQVAGDIAGPGGRIMQSIGNVVSDPLGYMSILGGRISNSDTFNEGWKNAQTRYDMRNYLRGGQGGYGAGNINQWISQQINDPNASKYAQKELESYLADELGVGQEQSLKYFRTQQMYGGSLRSSSYDPIAWMRDVEKYRSYGATDVLGSAQSIMQGRGYVSNEAEFGKALSGLSQRYDSIISSGQNMGIQDQLMQSSIAFANNINQYQVASGQQQISAFQAYDSGISGNTFEMQRQAGVYSGVAALRTGSVEFGANFGDQMSQHALGLNNQFGTTMYMNRMQQIGQFANTYGYVGGSSNAYANEAILANVAANGSERQFQRTMRIAQGDKWEISKQAQGMSGSSMDAGRFAMYNQIDTQSGLGVYETNISARELEGIQQWANNGGQAVRAALSNVDVSGGTTGLQATMRDMQYGQAQYQYGYQRDMSMAQFAMVTGGARPLAGGGSGTFGGALQGMVSPEIAGSLAQSFEKMAKAAEPTAAGLEKMGEIFDKYGFSLDTGSGMGQWQIEDAQRNLSRQQQMYGIQQQEAGLGLQQQGRDLRWRQFFEQLGFDKEKMQFGFNKQDTEMQISRQHQQTQEGWQMEDWSYGRSQMELQYGWQSEDTSLNLRYARGMQRRQLLKQQERQTIMHSMQAAKSDVDKGRLEETSGWSEEEYERKRQYFQQEMEFSKRAMDMRERHFREQFALEDQQFKMTVERHEQEKAWLQERWQLEDQSINLQRQWYVFQFEQSEKMAEMSQENAMNMKDMQLAMEGISLASRQSAAALEVSNKELKTLTDLMPELTAQIMSVPESHAEAGNKLVEQSSAQFQNLANSFATSMANMMKTITNSAGGSYSSSVKSYSTASGTSRTYASGGYTGDGAKYEERGSVHAGEYVIPQEGVPVVRGTDPASLDELKGIRKALEKLVSMGLYNVNATVYTSEKSVNARDLNPVDELFRTM